MSELQERIRDYRSRVRLGDRATQLTAASIVLAVALLALLLQSPSSTDANTIASQDGALTEDGTSADGSAVPTLSPIDVKGGGGAGGSAGGGASTGAVTGPSQAPGPGSVAVAPGETVKVGVTYLADPGTANAAAGFGGIGQVDQKRAWDTIIAEVNRNKVYGRKVVPVYYSFTTDDVTSKGAERIDQEVCAKFTQDDKVDMAWTSGGDSLQACFTKAKIPQIGASGGLSYVKTYKDFPYFITPSDAALDRMAEFQVDQLVKQRFFKEFKENTPPYSPSKPSDNKPRIGLIRYDQPSYDAAAAAMKKRLAANGLSLCSGCEFKVSYSADNVQEQLDDATEVNAAIQNCKSRPGGPCTHMLFLGSSAGVRITLFFVDGAEKQQYRPRLGFNPHDHPELVRDFLGPASYPQFKDSMLVAWDPKGFGIETPTFKKCRALFEKAGESFSGDEGSNKLAQIPGYCDTGAYYLAATKAAGPKLTPETWLQGVANVPVIPSAGTYRMQTKADRHDGVAAIQIGSWVDACSCFKPSTGVLPV